MNASTDMRAVIIPKSDQMNADDLLAGPITITIRDISIRPGTEQPVSIHFDGDNNKPFKPCKSMARVLVHAWGPDAKAYIGRSLTLYCDPKVIWAGMAVGGIRISHMTHIEREMLMALTATKGKRAPFIVKPLVEKPASRGVDKPAPADPAPSFELVNGDGELITYDKLGDYLTGLKLAISGAVEKAAVWSDNAKAFGDILERAKAKNATKAVTALEATQAEINATLA